jgi:hypothetical protein
VEIVTETPIFLFWEYLFRNFGILSLQCKTKTKMKAAVLSYKRSIVMLNCLGDP